ncbi:MAG: protein translocase subunit SecD [Bradymonadales bacterium]|nr:protein translocase subunit SecD [Bradymonadales bacterium]
MPSSWWYKFAFVLLLLVASIVILIPTVFLPEEVDDRDSWPGWYRWYTENIFSGRLTRGLDLQGGIHLQYTVDVDTAMARKLDTYAHDIENEMQAKGYEVQVRVLDDTSMEVTLPGDEAQDELQEYLYLYNLEVAEQSGDRFRLELNSDYLDQTRDWAIETAIATIRSRIDSLGVAEPSIRSRGNTDIIVELPGLGEERFADAKRLIGTTAQLEFRGVHPQDRTYWRDVAGLIPREGTIEYYRGSVEATDLEELRTFAATLENLDPSDPAVVPEDAIIAFEEQISYHPTTGQVMPDQNRFRMMLLNRRVEMTGETISDVRPINDPQTNRPFVSLTFDSEGKNLFCSVTTEYNQDYLAIVLDDIVKSAPIIEEPICEGRARINMGSSGSYEALYREVEGLVIVLRHGALPAPIEPQFETQIGPTLGADSVRQGTIAIIVGAIMVVFFMMLYYGLSGIIANLALILNVFFLFSLLAALSATLTLPGFAGIVLTVGMAVDANIIIYERIREELRVGKTARDAVSGGFQNARWTILDANITTAIAALVLANYGSGPIQGFAVTLMVGIITSVFTALFVSRLFFELYLAKSRTQRLSI